MSEQARKTALLTSVSIAVVTSVVAVLINLATGGGGNALIWILIFISSLVLGALPHAGHLAKQLRLRRVGLLVIAGMILTPALVSDDVSDRVSDDFVSGSGDVNEKERRAGSSKPNPLPGAVDPNPTNPDSLNVADRLTVTLRESSIVPKDIGIEYDTTTTVSAAPFEFVVSQGAFKADAILRDSYGHIDWYFEVVWPQNYSLVDRCQASTVKYYCAEARSEDGIHVMQSTNSDPVTGRITTQTTVVSLSNGPQAMIMQTSSSVRTMESMLSNEHVIKTAILMAESLQL